MNTQSSPANTAVDKLGVAIGFVLAFVSTMPVYHVTYDYAYQYALSYSHWEYLWFWELVWLCCLFGLIVACAWFAISTVIGFLKGLVISFVVFLSSLRR